MIQDSHERIRIATENIARSGLLMCYPPAKFGDDMFSGFCVIVLTYTYTRTEPLIALLTLATTST